MKNVLIGYQLNEIGELITHKKTWDSVDWAEKCFFAAVLFMIIFSLVATTIFTIWARNRMKRKKLNIFKVIFLLKLVKFIKIDSSPEVKYDKLQN